MKGSGGSHSACVMKPYGGGGQHVNRLGDDIFSSVWADVSDGETAAAPA
eukprot:CAMPEP_0115859580 /NCGR_PEP_ID=MMETSP0287-20121206/16689_1 /TAXON_ID=412157 /ORGANISM="Chrysochromulina rotalis, Strain UIO044" /LENGTH=48 /DNA_ID= /DNA_START= /DNA_END= /DNA_ORIENTATION=